MKKEYSVLMSVYQKENPEYFRAALSSIFHQTVLPTEIVLVCDTLDGGVRRGDIGICKLLFKRYSAEHTNGYG